MPKYIDRDVLVQERDRLYKLWVFAESVSTAAAYEARNAKAAWQRYTEAVEAFDKLYGDKA